MTTQFPSLKRSDVLACCFSSWYYQFRKISPKATIIKLEDDFLAYLHSDRVFLPIGSGPMGFVAHFIILFSELTFFQR